MIKLTSSLNVGGRTFPTKFYVRDVLYISKFECRNKECKKAGTYQQGECTGPSNDNWTCPACDNIKCNRYEYRTGTCNQKDGNGFECNSQPVCNSGQYYAADGGGKASCMDCMDGTFRADEEHREANCAKWSGECGADEHQTQAPSATQNRVCSSSTVCSADQYESKSKEETGGDRECTGLTQCPAGQYVSEEATATTDNVCGDCDGVDKFSSEEGQSACSTMGTCDAGEYVSTPGSASSDLECTSCDDKTYQSAGDHRETECMPQTFCGPGTFMTDSKYSLPKTKVITCEECDEGRFMDLLEHRETRCKTYSTRSCGRNEMMTYIGLKTQDAECVACPEGQHQPDYYHKDSMCKDTTSTTTETTATETITTETTVTETITTETTTTETTTTDTRTATITTMTTTTDTTTDVDAGDNSATGGSAGTPGGSSATGGSAGTPGGSSSTGASTGSKPNDSTGANKGNIGSTTTTAVVIVVALVVVVVIVAVAFIKVRQNRANGGGQPPGAFDNPMYDAAGPAFDPAYADPQQGGGNNGGGYMDVNPNQQQQGFSSGYMDVSPNTGAGEATSGYMDVGGAASQVIEASDEEEV